MGSFYEMIPRIFCLHDFLPPLRLNSVPISILVALIDIIVYIFIRVQSAFAIGQIYYLISNFSNYQESLNLPLPPLVLSKAD